MLGTKSIGGLVVGLCLAEILAMLGIASFAALLPDLSQDWQLSSTQAGWIGSAYFFGYTLAVPVLVSLTDRVDPARVFLFSVVLTAAANLAFAFGLMGSGPLQWRAQLPAWDWREPTCQAQPHWPSGSPRSASHG